MTEGRYSVASLDELEELLAADGTIHWRPIRRRFDIRGFGVNAYAAEQAGDHVVEDHTEASNGHQELYLVLHGGATFRIDGEEIVAPAGTLVFLRDPGVRRGAVANEAGTLVLAIGAPLGAAFEPSAWEHWFAAYAFADAGNLEAGIAELEAGLAAHPGHPAILYHLACLESRAERLDQALDHLTAAAEKDERFREWARDDPDLEPIRGDARFPG